MSDNSDIALKVLNQQCVKYHEDEETKETVVKAFGKLFDNGYAVEFKNLTTRQQKIILNKKVQHYIPWRTTFKASISTPCRPVMDASSKTRYRDDGTGGRCLNDLVMKGRVSTIDLIRMLMRFQVGRFAVTGDLKGFYTSFDLDEKQWNLQRCLYRKNLDPDLWC